MDAEYRLGVHASHCCYTHGCKYGDDDCPVERKEVAAMYKCEQCEWEEEQDRRNPRMQALRAEVADLRLQLDAEGIEDMRNEILYLKNKAQAEYDRGYSDGYEDHRANTRDH